jgi:phenylacetate-coenzyme A ligase PaaK-like adenylate-forming protein
VQSINSFKSSIFQINNQNFDEAALALFQFQYKNNHLYSAYVNYLGIKPGGVNSVDKIPFLPIRFFKNHKVVSGDFSAVHIFESSGTTQSTTSKHFMEDLQFYEQVSSSIFSNFFGPVQDSVILGLLPSYLERANSSLVYMVDHFIKNSDRAESGFYLNNHEKLVEQLHHIDRSSSRIFLFGVTFALLELAEKHEIRMDNLVILETGGMKGRGKELVREELHVVLGKAFHSCAIYSEYGMTELLSQAYMGADGYFKTPPWMKVFIRDINDPFSGVHHGKTGAINVIDLANVHSCAFIETEDLGVLSPSGFKVLGRLDNSDMRGCNLLIT